MISQNYNNDDTISLVSRRSSISKDDILFSARGKKEEIVYDDGSVPLYDFTDLKQKWGQRESERIAVVDYMIPDVVI